MLLVPSGIGYDSSILLFVGIGHVIHKTGLDFRPAQGIGTFASWKNAKACAMAVAPRKRHRSLFCGVNVEDQWQIHEDDVTRSEREVMHHNRGFDRDFGALHEFPARIR